MFIRRFLARQSVAVWSTILISCLFRSFRLCVAIRKPSRPVGSLSGCVEFMWQPIATERLFISLMLFYVERLLVRSVCLSLYLSLSPCQFQHGKTSYHNRLHCRDFYLILGNIEQRFRFSVEINCAFD